MRKPPPHWLPWLGPILAAGAGGTLSYFWWRADFWSVLGVALVCGFAPIIAYRLWKRAHHR